MTTTSPTIEEMILWLDKRGNGGNELIYQAIRAELTAPQDSWRTMDSAPKEEDYEGFLVLSENPDNHITVVEVAWFEGNIYPVYLGGNVSWDDRIINATHWMPLQDAPQPASDGVGK